MADKKEKNPNRVAAGKKVWRNMSPGTKARRLACLRRGRKGKSSSKKTSSHHRSKSPTRYKHYKKSQSKTVSYKRRKGWIFG